MIRVDNLTKRFGHVVAVDALSFEVERGDVVGFLGPNGAGKTTTMRIITGFIPATGGTVSVAGHDIFDEPLACKRRIGYLPESVPVYPDMEVEQYLRFVCELKGIPRARHGDEAERAMRLTDILDRRTRISGHLSKGLKKRVGIAQALLGDPDVLILDEPTEGLDPNQVLSIRDLVSSLAQDRTVVLSTHILSEVEQTCSRVLILDQGRLVAADTVDHLRDAGAAGRISLRLLVRGANETIDATLATLGAETLTSSSEADGLVSLRIRIAPDARVESVSRALVEAGLGLVEITRERQSLEEVFVKLTAGAATAEDA